MPITSQQIQVAQAAQHNAAHDPHPQIRLIAGPGTGKSYAIGERVVWLLRKGVSPQRVFLVSFTRAASLYLERKTHDYCHRQGLPIADQVRVSTLHSLALRALRRANLLTAYPAPPLVMDDWELENILDKEFHTISRYKEARCKTIRRHYEAFCGTGQWDPPNYIPPSPPVSDAERSNYQLFHSTRTQIYSCVLPGEIVRQCVEKMRAKVLDPAALLGIEHLIVDEYQDLNPMDLEFVDLLANTIESLFVAGDDDQSIYSFRFARPSGIQSFTTRYGNVGAHELRHCFRCTPSILNAARTLLNQFYDPDRIPKGLVSLYEQAEPPESGLVHLWKFGNASLEAKAIARSCNTLITTSDLQPQQIMILINNRPAQLKTITDELDAQNVPFESPREDRFTDASPGRFALALLRIACDRDDYVAHRTVLGSQPHVGPGTCNRIAEAVANYSLPNFRALFYDPLPIGVLKGRPLSALSGARDICMSLLQWQPQDTLAQRCHDIYGMLQKLFGSEQADKWTEVIGHLPESITLKELRDYLWAEGDEQQASIVASVYDRLNLPEPPAGFLPDRVRIMTMHGAKGLDAKVVFIPGLVEEILPGPQRKLYPGLVLEAARMLYVSVTRAQAACILSYPERAFVYGEFGPQTPSRFTPYLGGSFQRRDDGLTADEVEEISRCCRNLQ